MTQAPEKKRKSIWPVTLRIVVSAALILIVYSSVDFSSLLTTLKGLSLTSVLLLMFLYAFSQFMSAAKWNIFLVCSNIVRPFYKVIQAYFFGMFVNAFGGLGTVGGDVARSLALLPGQGKRAASLATVVADRLHGLATLLSIGAVSILVVRPENLHSWVIGLSLVGILALLIFWKLGPVALLKLIPASHRLGPAAVSAAAAFPTQPKPLCFATILSACVHCLQIFMHYIIAQELGAEISLAYLFAVIPLVNAASALPISINGIGIREGLYTLFFFPLGVSSESVVAMGAVWILVVTSVSALVAFLVSPRLLFKKNQVEEPPFDTKEKSGFLRETLTRRSG